MENKKNITILNFLFIFLVINYRVISMFITRIDSGQYVLLLLSLVVVFVNLDDFQRLQTRKPIGVWLIWCIYTFFNYFFHPHTFGGFNMFELYLKIFIPLIALTTVVIEYRKNPVKTLWLCFAAHAVYMFIGYRFDAGVLYRGEGEENVLGNAYANTSCFTLFYMSLLNRKKKINTYVFLALVVVVFIVLGMAATRKAFGAALIFVAFWALSQLNLKKSRSWILVIGSAFLGYWGYNRIIEETYIGTRMEIKEEVYSGLLPSDAPKFLEIFGDRGPHYYYGWYGFLNHPLFGVGIKQGRIGTGVFSSYIHSEYMAQLVDGGIIAFILFAMFYYWIIVHTIKRIRYDDELGRCMLGGLLATLFLYLTTWAWEFSYYFVCLGVLIGYDMSPSEAIKQE